MGGYITAGVLAGLESKTKRSGVQFFNRPTITAVLSPQKVCINPLGGFPDERGQMRQKDFA